MSIMCYPFKMLIPIKIQYTHVILPFHQQLKYMNFKSENKGDLLANGGGVRESRKFECKCLKKKKPWKTNDTGRKGGLQKKCWRMLTSLPQIQILPTMLYIIDIDHFCDLRKFYRTVLV